MDYCVEEASYLNRKGARSEFKDHLKRYGIKPILARVKHPQTTENWNGFSENKRNRSAFSSFEELINWYNDRPHGSLNFLSLETPEKASRRKMPLEAYFSIVHRLFGLRKLYE